MGDSLVKYGNRGDVHKRSSTLTLSSRMDVLLDMILISNHHVVT